MDTPERNQIGTPVSKIEESPFSNFANNLSPINPIKTLHVSQTFNSLSFTSPPSVFTSPHVSLQKESRFLRRHQASDLAKTHFSCDEGNKDSEAGGALSSDEQTDHLTNEQFRGERASGSEAAADPETLCEVSECPTELQSKLKYDSGSPGCENATSCGIEQNCEPKAAGALVPFASERSFGGSFGAKLSSQEREHLNEEATCWSLISSIVFDSPNDPATLKGSFQKSIEEEANVFASLLSRFPPIDVNDPQNSHHTGPVNYNEVHEPMNQSALPVETGELTQADQEPENLSISSLNGCLSGDSGEKSGNEPFSNLQRGMRRRCLIFETGAKNNVDRVIYPSSSSIQQNEEMSVPDDKQPITPRDSSRCILPGIGLHLNALAAASRECRVPHQDTPSPTNQEALMILSASTSSEKNVSPDEHGVQIVEDSLQASTTYAVTQELNPNSPKKKRRKSENIDEAEGCKRCNCKKSKCLKLYCECFAAGVYCVDSCSCRDCFNKPIHEDTVLATRKQIESRNPLAFAPKVIRTSDSAQDLGEDTSRTPASARHKRGCNCKKSNCLKKYCECYQGGVGCSISCRCEGCKNAFGRKDGPSLLRTETEIEEAQVSEKHIMDNSSNPPAFCGDEDQSSEFTLPKTPLRHFRPSIPLPTSSKGKPPRSLGAMGSSSCLQPIDGPGRSTFLRCQSKIEKHIQDEIPTVLQNGSPPSSGIKTLSPNGKRISPPHHAKGQSPVLRSSRKLILQSIPSFPSLTPRR